MKATNTDTAPPSLARSVMTWASLALASALPTATLLFRYAGTEEIAWVGVLLGFMFWVAVLTFIDVRLLRAKRRIRNLVLVRGIKIQAIGLVVLYAFSQGIGVVLLYLPAVLALSALEALTDLVLGVEWTHQALSGVAVAALVTIAFGGCHFLAAVTLGLIFRPVEPSTRWRSKTHPLGATVTEQCSA